MAHTETKRTLPDGTPAGSGSSDRHLAEALASASTPAEADQIAHAAGHQDAADARKWLEDRS